MILLLLRTNVTVPCMQADQYDQYDLHNSGKDVLILVCVLLGVLGSGIIVFQQDQV
jgi:hypothetical protein